MLTCEYLGSVQAPADHQLALASRQATSRLIKVAVQIDCPSLHCILLTLVRVTQPNSHSWRVCSDSSHMFCKPHELNLIECLIAQAKFPDYQHLVILQKYL
jgi:aspartokinase-like uncharacterized kinase